MRPLTILLVVERLARRSGLSLYVHDVALELFKRGHKPIVFPSEYGEVAAELRAATIPVPMRLEDIGPAPDLIHGHTQFETVQALLRFPAAPAVFSCHGWRSRKNEPPRFPRVRRYLPVDFTARDRLLLEHAIPDSQIRVHANFVDMARFVPRAPLPSRPARAFLFNSKLDKLSQGFVTMIAQACDQRGIALDVLDREGIDRPEAVIGGYDLVFARARCALESMAVGTAVIACGHEGLGPMVTTANLDVLRELNFGLRAFRRAPSPAAIGEEIDRYDAGDAAIVSRRIRAEASLERAVTDLLGTYHEVLVEHRGARIDHEEEHRVLAGYLAAVSRRADQRSARTGAEWRKRDKAARKRLEDEIARVESDRAIDKARAKADQALLKERLRAEYAEERRREQAEQEQKYGRKQAEAAARLDQVHAAYLRQIERRDDAALDLKAKLEAARAALAETRGQAAELKALRGELARHEKAAAHLERQRAGFEKARARFEKDRARLEKDRSDLEKDRARLGRRRPPLEPPREDTSDARARLEARLEESRGQNAKLSAERNAVRTARDQYRERAEARVAALKDLQAEHERLRRAYREARQEIASLRGGLLWRLRAYLKGLPIPGAPWRRPQPSESQPK